MGQTYDSIEYILIDGGSSDGTIDIIKKYTDRISFWISEPDNGIYDAMNKGLRNATGEYVWFINAGDLINSNETLENLINQCPNNVDIFYGETLLINGDWEVLGTRSELTTRKLPKNLTWKNMNRGMVVSHQSIIVKKSIAPMYNLIYKCSADIDWVIKCLKNSTSTINTNSIVSKYLIGGYSIKFQKKCWIERFKLYVFHYGVFSAILNYIFIAFRYLFFKLRLT